MTTVNGVRHAGAMRADRRRSRVSMGRYRALALALIAAVLAVTVWVLIVARDGMTMYTRYVSSSGGAPAGASGRPASHRGLESAAHGGARPLPQRASSQPGSATRPAPGAGTEDGEQHH